MGAKLNGEKWGFTATKQSLIELGKSKVKGVGLELGANLEQYTMGIIKTRNQVEGEREVGPIDQLNKRLRIRNQNQLSINTEPSNCEQELRGGNQQIVGELTKKVRKI